MKPQRFRKKAVLIEAMQFDGSKECGYEILMWSRPSPGIEMAYTARADHPNILKIQTLEGVMTALKGDWIIKGIKGEFYPCKPDIFEASYRAENQGFQVTAHSNLADNVRKCIRDWEHSLPRRSKFLSNDDRNKLVVAVIDFIQKGQTREQPPALEVNP